MSAIHGVVPRTAGPLGAIERAAWGIPLSTRRLFGLLAVIVALSLAAAAAVAELVADHNASTIDQAASNGLGIASAATEFRTSLVAADAEAAATLISGGLEDPARRARYDADVLAASHALVDAGLVAVDDDAEDISALADGLTRYAGLVETSRANSRQGFPVGAAYLNQARTLVRDELVPPAERLRRVGEQRIAEAANEVGGPVRTLAMAVLVVAMLVLLAASALVAGRSRRIAHPALLASLIVLVVAFGVVTAGMVSQGSDLRQAATRHFDAYVDANQAAFAVSNLRVTEIGAVAARGSGAPLYDQFDTDAGALLQQLGANPDDASLEVNVRDYVDNVGAVRQTDAGGDNQGAAANTLSGASAMAFTNADQAAAVRVHTTSDDLAARFEAASNADVPPFLTLLLGVVAAALGAAGILARGRRYR